MQKDGQLQVPLLRDSQCNHKASQRVQSDLLDCGRSVFHRFLQRTLDHYIRSPQFHFLCVNQIRNVQITNKIHVNVYGILNSLNSHQHVSAAIAAIFRVILLLQEYKSTNVVSCVAVAT